MDQFIILNAQDLNTTKYACYYDMNLQINQLNVTYLGAINALRIAPLDGKELKFSQF